MIGSAAFGEAFSRLSSFLIANHEEKAAARDNIDRLELAHIRMKAALETTDRRRRLVDDGGCSPSLLLWQAKLKRAAEECGEALEMYKRRAVEDEEEAESFAGRIARAAKSAVFSLLASHGGEQQQQLNQLPCPSVVVRRYERYADSAGEMLRFMEYGAAQRRRRQHMLLDPLLERLLDGKFVWCRMVQGRQYRSFRVWPMASSERGLDAMAIFVYQDRAAPERDFSVGLQLRLRDRADDVVAITFRCLQSFRPQLKSVAAAAEEELAVLAAMNPLHEPCVPAVGLKLCSLHAALAQSQSSLPAAAAATRRVVPRASRPRVRSVHAEIAAAVEIVDGEEERGCRANVTSMQQWDELLIPRAIGCLSTKAEPAATYEAFWDSDHGAAYLRVEKTSARNAST
ncbi:hypothetical protein E2562_006659 [Oryza meyeriana var. granulata]|uniref:Uncharacterized protein n=1 Tax=Oryza meyeriana var. granulata TaxID=110450 RepID=A0A6G1EF28_9ORYZ|nr:hypothetical protein E2562_006659 [Oryza meyeriana var. granulata]